MGVTPMPSTALRNEAWRSQLAPIADSDGQGMFVSVAHADRPGLHAQVTGELAGRDRKVAASAHASGPLTISMSFQPISPIPVPSALETASLAANRAASAGV